MRKKIVLITLLFIFTAFIMTGCFRKNNSIDTTGIESTDQGKEGSSPDKTGNEDPPLDVEDEVIIEMDETESAGGM